MEQKTNDIDDQITYSTPNAETTIELVTALQKGEPSAADAVFEAFHNDIYFFILKSVKNPDLASHLTQDTFSEINTNIATLPVPSAFLPWCKKIAHKRYVAYIKKRQELLLDDKKTDYALATTYNELEFEFCPDEKVDSEDLRQTICDMLDALPEKLRTALVMRYYDELSIKDIAKIQKTSERTVTDRLTEGRSAIEQSIEAFEKKHNIKLENTGIIPIILWFFREDRLKNGISLTEMTPVAKEALANLLKKAPKIIVKKIVLRVVALLIMTACTTLFLYFSPKDSSPIIPPASELVELETEKEFEHTSETDDIKKPNSTPTDSFLLNNNPEEILLIDSEGLEFTLSDDGTSYTVSGIGTCTDTKILIPSEYNGITVSTIGEYAFNNCLYITDIVIPDTVTIIEKNAFSYSPSLTSISIPSSVTTMESYLISGCNNLKRLIVDANNPIYHSSGNCIIETASKTLILGCPVSTIPSDGSVTNIGTFSFDSYESLKNIAIPEGITNIETKAFFNVEYLSAISLPKSLQSIEESAFRNCSSLTDIYYSGTKEQWYSFKKGDAWYPEHGKYIIHCTDGIIYSSTHPDAPQIDSVGLNFTLSEDKTYYILTDLGLCTDAKIIIPAKHNGLPVTTIGFGAFSASCVQEVIIPNSITTICDEAFIFCSNLRSITIPSSVTKIGTNVFRDNNTLSKIIVENGNRFYHSEGNCLIETATKTLLAGCYTSVIPTDGSVTAIGEYAFYGHQNLTSLTIPNTITSIGSRSFADTGINSLVIPYGVKSIGESAFSNANLSSISLSNSIESIGDGAFVYCDDLIDLTIPSSVTFIGSMLTSGCTQLKTLSVEKGNLKYHSNGNCIIETATKTLIAGCNTSSIPSDGSVTHIDTHSFWLFDNLTSFTIPEGVTNIGINVFYGCENLKEITLPVSLTTIGNEAFRYKTNLTNIYYAGTMEQWYAIDKGYHWYPDHEQYTIYCLDGTISN